MALEPPRKLPRWVLIASVVAVISVAFVYTLVSKSAGTRALGAVIIFGAVVQQWMGAIPYGWEGQEPSGYLRGWKVAAFNAVLGCAGFAMLIWGKAPWPFS